jgi:hypothetical protein
MAVKKNEFGRPVEWRQSVSDSRSRKKIFKNQDVVIMTLDRKSGFTFGTPYVIPVLDDVRALRRLEELVELVTHKHTFPFFHARVGTPENPAGYITDPSGGTIAEVDVVSGQIDNMPTEGGLVTSERVEITMLGTEGEVLDLKPYLGHFENRVLGGLRLSGVDIGRGDTANKATAQSVTKNLIDACTEIQNAFCEIWDSKINDILLMEGGFDLNDENRVRLRFPEIDREEMRAQQLYWELYKKPELIISAVDETFSAQNANKALAVNNKTQPENQHGKAITKKSIPANDGRDHRRMDLEIASRYTIQLDYYWMELKQELLAIKAKKQTTAYQDRIKNLFYGHSQMMLMDARKFLIPELELGYAQACKDLGITSTMDKSVINYFQNKYVKSQLIRINRKAMIMLGLDREGPKATGRVPGPFDIAGTFTALSVELKAAGRQHTDLAYKVGYLEALKASGQDTIEVTADDYQASEDWAAQPPRTMKIADVHKRDICNRDENNRLFIMASGLQLEGQGEENE